METSYGLDAYERLAATIRAGRANHLSEDERTLLADMAETLARAETAADARPTWEAARALLNGLVASERLAPRCAAEIWHELRGCGPAGAPRHYRVRSPLGRAA